MKLTLAALNILSSPSTSVFSSIDDWAKKWGDSQRYKRTKIKRLKNLFNTMPALSTVKIRKFRSTVRLLPLFDWLSFLFGVLVLRCQPHARHLLPVDHELLILLALFHLIRLYYLVLHPGGVVGQHLKDLLVWHQNVSGGELDLILLALTLLSGLLDLNLLGLLALRALLGNLLAILLRLSLIVDLKLGLKVSWDLKGFFESL